MAKLGFAFSFGARDDGMGKAMSSAVDSLSKINKLMGVQNDIAKRSRVAGALKAAASGAMGVAGGIGGAAKGLMGAFGRGMQNRVNSFNLANMSANIRSLTEDSGNLSNSMESIGASYAQQAKPALALMGVTGKELQRLTGQASGMAYGLNVSVETVTKTMGTLRTASAGTKSVFDALGMSTADFVKLAEGTGVATEQIGSAAGLMTDQWKMGAQQAKQMLEYSVAMGQKGGVGGLMYSGLSDQVTTINNMLSFQVASHQRSADELDRMLKSSVRLAGAYKQLGFSAEESAKSASETSSKFLEWQIQMERFQAGEAGAELPQIITDLSAIGMGTDEAMGLLQLGASDSAAAMLKLSQYMQAASKSGKNIDTATLANLQATLGGVNTNIISLAMSGDKSTQVLDAMSNATVKTDGALKQLSKDAYSSGRTLQESLDMAKEAFMTRVRGITRPEVVGYVKEEIQSYKELGKQAKDLAKDSTWGPLVKAYSIFDQMGAKGVILHFGKQLGMNTKEANKFAIGMDMAVDGLGKMRNSIAPVFELLGAGPFAGIAAGVAGWFMLPQESRDKIYATFEPMINAIKQKAGEIWDNVSGHLVKAWDSIDWQGLIDKAKPALTSFAITVGQMFQKLFPKLADFLGIGDALQKAQDERARIAQAQKISAGAVEAAGKYGESLKQQKMAEIAQREGRSRALTPEEQMGVNLEAASKGKALAEAQKRMMVFKESGYGSVATALSEGEQARKMASKSTGNENQIAFAGKMAVGERLTAEMGKRMAAGDVQGLGQISPVMAAMYQSAGGLPLVGGYAKNIMTSQMLSESESYGQRGMDFAEGIQGSRRAAGTAGLATVAPAVPATLAAIQTQFDTKQTELATSAQKSGATVTEMLAAGIAKGTEKTLEPQMSQTAEAMASFWPRSEPKTGPLSGGMLPNAGSEMLNLVLKGMKDTQRWFQDGFAKVLTDSATFAINAFQAKALEQFKASPINQEIFGKITAQYSGVLSEDDKKVLKQSLDMSGLYGVINAVIMDGVETRKVLTSIADNTAGLKGWNPGGGGGSTVAQGTGSARQQNA